MTYIALFIFGFVAGAGIIMSLWQKVQRHDAQEMLDLLQRETELLNIHDQESFIDGNHDPKGCVICELRKLAKEKQT